MAISRVFHANDYDGDLKKESGPYMAPYDMDHIASYHSSHNFKGFLT